MYKRLGHSVSNSHKRNSTCSFLDSFSTTVKRPQHSHNMQSRIYVSYYHHGKPICVYTFIFIHTMDITRFKNISSSFQKCGFLQCTHGNTKRLPWNSLSLSSIQHVISFWVNYTEENGLVFPGRIPGYTSTDLKLIPSSKSKKAIWTIIIWYGNKFQWQYTHCSLQHVL